MSLTQTGDRGVLPTCAFAFAAITSVVALFLPVAPEVESDVPGLDKLVHLLLFAALAVTARWRFGMRAGVAVTLLVYAAASEVAQAVLLAERSGDVLDLLADVGGTALGLLATDAWRRSRPGSVADDIRS